MNGKVALSFLFLLNIMAASAIAKEKINVLSSNNNECIEHIEAHAADGGLFMDKCYLHDRDIPQILSYLNDHPEIIRLSLSDNQLGDQSAELLSANTTIQYLFLT
ncbi:MAG: hypothetical protein ACRCXC_01710 [Legionella sp.]